MIFSGTMEEFNNYVEPCSFLVTFGNPPAPEELKNIDGISEVEPLTLREYRVYFTAPAGLHNRSLPGVRERMAIGRNLPGAGIAGYHFCTFI